MCRHLRFFSRSVISCRFIIFFITCMCTALFIMRIILVNKQVLRPWKYVPRIEVTPALSPNAFDDTVYYVLLSSHQDWAPFYYFTPKNVFIKNNCTFTNCFVTTDVMYFGSNISNFHAIAFNGRPTPLSKHFARIPRWPHQKMIYFNTESSANFFIGHHRFDGFFNWTATYRLDSDIPYPYILIKDRSGKVVGPKEDMQWRENMTVVDEDLVVRLLAKKKQNAAVAFTSHCNAKSGRDSLTNKLKKHLASLGYTLDIYGKCGNKTCPLGLAECDKIVEGYHFYLAFENSFAQDYVTEKLLRALNHDAVPIVLGGAEYTRFLPPNSYIDASKYQPDELAKLMVELIKNPAKYHQFFGWKAHYTYHDPMARENVCSLCAALNKKYHTQSVYQDFGAWWNH